MSASVTPPLELYGQLRAALPAGGMFKDKEWRLSPEAFPLTTAQMDSLRVLGQDLWKFQRACNRLYFRSAEEPNGPLGWLARLLDQGKPADLVALGRRERTRDAIPRVLRPDLILTENGFSVSELDSLPGGIGLTGFLGEIYAGLGQDVVGGGEGMARGFSDAFLGADVFISKESADYEPEMRWLLNKINELEGTRREVQTEETLVAALQSGDVAAEIYRFFELWDMHNVRGSSELLQAEAEGELGISPPLKPFLEEKLWLALFWSPALEEQWLEELGAEGVFRLRDIIPEGWVVDPVELPPYAEWPGLGIWKWEELGGFSQKERELVLKISGFSEKGWGSRGVFIGHDLPAGAWKAAIAEAMESFPKNPYILQRFHAAKVVRHPWFEGEDGAVSQMEARVRLCPYFFIGENGADLGGVLATVCPADKKILHGMKDAILLPCRLVYSL